MGLLWQDHGHCGRHLVRTLSIPGLPNGLPNQRWAMLPGASCLPYPNPQLSDLPREWKAVPTTPVPPSFTLWGHFPPINPVCTELFLDFRFSGDGDCYGVTGYQGITD